LITQIQQIPQPVLTVLSNFTGAGDLECRDKLLADLLDWLQEISGATCCLLLQPAGKPEIQLKATSPPSRESEMLRDFCGQILEKHGNLLEQGQTITFSQHQPFLFVRTAPYLQSCPIRCLLFLPLSCQQSNLGILCLCYSQLEPNWTEADSTKIRNLAASIALLLQEKETATFTDKRFLSHITHELRTPLTGILGFAKMLREEIYGSLNAKQKQYVSGIVSSGEHLLALVNDFLDLSKIDANREELFLEKVVVEDICLAALCLVEAKVQEAGLALNLEIEPDVSFCCVDQRRVKQILLNLLSNAIKFTESGKISLKVKLEGRMLAFSITDTGIGIQATDLEKLFQPFQQLDNPLNRKQKGTGLGLAVSRKLARLHGGDLSVTSQPGRGSCFTLRLPV
jgi:signal transduction histidine kinase